MKVFNKEVSTNTIGWVAVVAAIVYAAAYASFGINVIVYLAIMVYFAASIVWLTQTKRNVWFWVVVVYNTYLVLCFAYGFFGSLMSL